jgi:hypothetical protein
MDLTADCRVIEGGRRRHVALRPHSPLGSRPPAFFPRRARDEQRRGDHSERAHFEFRRPGQVEDVAARGKDRIIVR